MNDNIMRALGFGEEVDRINAGRCPLCGRDMAGATFRDALSRKEFGISGLCQACQDEAFAPLIDDEDEPWFDEDPAF